MMKNIFTIFLFFSNYLFAQTIEPLKNTLLLFPSWLKHRVEPNLSKKNRICISFNLGKGIYPSMGL